MAAAAVGGILLASVTLYAVLGGADFGGGLWDLLAGGDRRGRAPRALIEESITPVWEANHVWLIFDLVIFWTAFPHAFAAVMTTAALPLWLAVAGIVLRGAGFAFREELSRLPQRRAAGATFAFSSLLTPFFMGTVVGAIASGQIPANAGHASLSAWTSATSLLTGLLFVGTCSYIAAVFLVGEAAHRGDRSLQHYFTRRAQAAAIVTGALSLATLAELHISNRGIVQPPHRPGARTGDHRRAVRPGRPGPADGIPPARHPDSGRAWRGRRDLGVGRGAVPGATARHLNDADRRGDAARHPGRDHLAVRRRRPDPRALLRAAVRPARATGPAGRRRGNRLPRPAR